MASYAALLSAMHTINQIKNHPRPPISLDTKQMDSLTQNLSFLLNFLESFGQADDDLESRIAEAAYAAEDVIESHIVDRLLPRSNISTVDLYEGLEQVIRQMDLIRKEVILEENVIKEKLGAQRPDKLPTKAYTRQSSDLFEFDGVVMNDVLDKLTGQKRDFQVISIAGMGGIGKTTLAQNIYKNPLIVHHFDVLFWVTISQEYSVKQILSQLLPDGSTGSDDTLGERVHKNLWDRRYLIVMDDIWCIEAWDQVRSFFPKNNNGSRVMITTRLSKLAFDLSGSQVFRMNFLDEDKSWTLFCKTLFGKEDCPIELTDIGKDIARKCRGLPLSIVVIGGILTNSNMTQTYWEYILKDLISFINMEDDEYCLQLLGTSYKELPIHLKSCFLYMGIFSEDEIIRVSELAKLWVAEGILRPSEDKCLDKIAEDYIMELVDRNLILVYGLRWNGKVKLCKIHDLLRDLCLRESRKHRYLSAIKDQWDHNIPQSMKIERRICIHDYIEESHSLQFFHAMKSASLNRSFIVKWGWHSFFLSLDYRLLRVLSQVDRHSLCSSRDTILHNVNLRYLAICRNLSQLSLFPLLWNLQTIKVNNTKLMTAPSEIWKMLQLRHVMITDLQLPDPRSGENDLPLGHLQTLSCVFSFKCSKEVINRIPNIRILKIQYDLPSGGTKYSDFCLNNLCHLKNLQTLNLHTGYYAQFDSRFQRYMGQNLNFPNSLKKLTLSASMCNWEECMTKIGSLPFLEFLRMDRGFGWGTEWETVEGQFRSLKFLQLHYCCELRYWWTEDTHFPRLEHLLLEHLDALEEIPPGIGDISTLKSIALYKCSKSAADSATRIIQEQIELGNMDIKLRIVESDETAWWSKKSRRI